VCFQIDLVYHYAYAMLIALLILEKYSNESFSAELSGQRPHWHQSLYMSDMLALLTSGGAKGIECDFPRACFQSRGRQTPKFPF